MLLKRFILKFYRIRNIAKQTCGKAFFRNSIENSEGIGCHDFHKKPFPGLEVFPLYNRLNTELTNFMATRKNACQL